MISEAVTPCTTLPMQIDPTPTGALPELTVTRPAAPAAAWQAGQLLSARVLSVTPDGRLSLLVQGQQIEARSPLALVAGQQLTLMVELDADHIMLRIVDNPPQEQPLSAAWRNALPRQMPLATALRVLARLLQAPEQPLPEATTAGRPVAETAGTPPAPLLPDIPSAALTTALRNPGEAPKTSSPTQPPSEQLPPPTAKTEAPPTLPPKVQQLLQTLLEQLPTAEQLTTADGLRTALRDSGLFLQARLAQGDGSVPERDLQSALLRLSAAVGKELAALPAASREADGAHADALIRLSQTLQQLVQHADGAVARMQVQQLHTLATRSDSANVWLLELPLRNGQETEALQLRIQREKKSGHNGEDTTAWSVRLHFDNPRYGAIDSQVNLTGGKIGVSFWSETPATAARLQQHIDELRARLQQAGLEVDQLLSRAGAPPPTSDAQPSGLLNIRA